VPVLVALILVDTEAASYAAVVVFVVGALSDGVDGYLARRNDQVTRTGAWLDPLSDKLLVAAPVLTLTALGEFPVWAAAIIIVREVAVVVLRIWLGRKGVSMPASELAKLKTGAQLVAITLYLWPLAPGAETAREIALVIAVVITVVSGVEYFFSVPRRLREART
jgi:CDP-diacylglycerol--glycerol-3-phosphate 3-phosphatidyltransferase